MRIWGSLRKISRWQRSRPAVPYSLCYRPVEALAVFQALRACGEQQTLDHELAWSARRVGPPFGIKADCRGPKA